MTEKTVSNPRSFKTSPIRCSYVAVFATRRNEASGRDEYGLEMLIPKDDEQNIAKIKKAMISAMEEKFGEKKAFVVDAFKAGMKKFFETGKHGIDPDDNIYFPLKDGDVEKAETDDGQKVPLTKLRPEVAGHYLLRCKAQDGNKPDVIDRELEDVTDKTAFVSGDYARLALGCAAFEQKGNRGCSFWLNGVQVWKKGEPLGGAGKLDAKKAFDDDFEEKDWD